MPKDAQTRCFMVWRTSAVPNHHGRRRAMSRDSGARRRWWRQLEPGFLLILASYSQLPPTSSVAIPRLPAGEARLWFYRDGGPYEIQASPYLRLNGCVAGISEPDGAFYRDVTPRHSVGPVHRYLDSSVDPFA